MRVPIVVLMLLAAGGGVAGQRAPAVPTNPFASVKTLACSFPTYAAGNWSGATPTVLSNTQEFSFQIDSLDLKGRQARMVGGSGTSLLSLTLTDTGITVIEPTPIGNFNITTVFTGGGSDNKFLAVHSRHLGDIAAPPRASQAYGACAIGS